MCISSKAFVILDYCLFAVDLGLQGCRAGADDGCPFFGGLGGGGKLETHGEKLGLPIPLLFFSPSGTESGSQSEPGEKKRTGSSALEFTILIE